jgi:hypothetical protein
VLNAIAALPTTNQGGAFAQLPLVNTNQLVEITSMTQDTGILGTVYADSNLNGTRDAQEPGVAGATVFLDESNSGVLAPGDPTAITDSNGEYAFTGLAAGSYVVREQVSPNHGVQITGPVGDAATITVTTGEVSAGPDFGEFQTSTIVPLALPTISYPLSGDANANYVEALFVNLLGHAADPASLSLWTGQLDAGGSLSSVATGIWTSSEHLGTEVDGFYETFLHRASEPLGRSYWIGLLQSGVGEQAIVEGFLTSAEYQRVNSGAGAMSAALYADILSRPGDPAGLAAWQSWLATNSSLVAADAFTQSAESYLRIIDSFYSAFLRRAIDASGQALVSELEAGTATIQQVAVGILSSHELFEDATVNAGH